MWRGKRNKGKPREEEKEQNLNGRKKKFSSPFNLETNPAYMLSLLSSQFYFFLFPFALQRQGMKKEEKKK